MGEHELSKAPPAHPARVLLGGLLMGLANLVPGVSGGTMILAMGLYERFIGALADLSRLRFSRSACVFLGLIGVGAAMALLGLSGLAVSLVSESRWIMYSLFSGMTLGGAPELLRECQPRSWGVGLAFGLALALMGALAFGLQGANVPENTFVFLCMGVLGASSMILPGISGSYMLLIFGMYDVVVGSLSLSALRADPGASLAVLVPVAAGAVLGMGLLSNLLKSMLARHSAISHALLLGLLLGSVLGLYPFRESVHPELSHKPMRKAVALLLAGEPLEAVNHKYALEISPVRAGELRTSYAGLGAGDLKQLGDELKPFEPSGGEMASALGLLLVGVLVTRSLGARSGARGLAGQSEGESTGG